MTLICFQWLCYWLCACCFVCRSYSCMDCLFSFYARSYVLCNFHSCNGVRMSHWIKGYLTWLDLNTHDNLARHFHRCIDDIDCRRSSEKYTHRCHTGTAYEHCNLQHSSQQIKLIYYAVWRCDMVTKGGLKTRDWKTQKHKLMPKDERQLSIDGSRRFFIYRGKTKLPLRRGQEEMWAREATERYQSTSSVMVIAWNKGISNDRSTKTGLF